MLGFEAVGGIPVAGAPTDSSNGVVQLLGSGTYVLTGYDANITKTGVMQLGSGELAIESGGAQFARQVKFYVGGGGYNIEGFDARIFQSSYFYGDPEIIYVPVEPTNMAATPEPRNMTIAASDATYVADEPGADEEPRLRRT